ncbi:MAG: response regulator [Chloroflexi bacterium]|nr:MAG: response regulator [Chloroflexota bacterium]
MKKIKILLVEDEALTALLLTRNLEMIGYHMCAPVGTGEAAVETAAAEQPDVVLMDIRLGSAMDGIEAAKQIKAIRPVPIVFMTGYEDDQTRARADSVGPAAYLVKPVTPDDVEPVIADIFGAG